MELILKKGEDGLAQDFLIYGKTYHIRRNKKYIGIARYIDDPIHGEGFFIEKESGVLKVCIADEWVFNQNEEK